MKKLLCFLASVLILVSSAMAAPETIDLETMSFDELKALESRLIMALWHSPEATYAYVPAGAYLIGEDIMPGEWTLTAMAGEFTTVKIVEKVDRTGTKEAVGAAVYYKTVLCSSVHPYYEKYPNETAVVTLPEGAWLIIEQSTVAFTRRTPTPTITK